MQQRDRPDESHAERLGAEVAHPLIPLRKRLERTKSERRCSRLKTRPKNRCRDRSKRTRRRRHRKLVWPHSGNSSSGKLYCKALLVEVGVALAAGGTRQPRRRPTSARRGERKRRNRRKRKQRQSRATGKGWKLRTRRLIRWESLAALHLSRMWTSGRVHDNQQQRRRVKTRKR